MDLKCCVRLIKVKEIERNLAQIFSLDISASVVCP